MMFLVLNMTRRSRRVDIDAALIRLMTQYWGSLGSKTSLDFQAVVDKSLLAAGCSGRTAS
jgi:hypothetical protein